MISGFHDELRHCERHPEFSIPNFPEGDDRLNFAGLGRAALCSVVLEIDF